MSMLYASNLVGATAGCFIKMLTTDDLLSLAVIKLGVSSTFQATA